MNSNPTYKSIWKFPILASTIKSAQAPKAVNSRVPQVMACATALSSQFPVTNGSAQLRTKVKYRARRRPKTLIREYSQFPEQ